MDISQLPQSVQDHIKHLERMREDFVGNVSHELRTPLTVIHGYLESIVDQSSQDMANIPMSIVDQMYAQSLRMQNIIKDLLLLSQIEDHEAPIGRWINLPKLIHRVVEDAKMISQGQHAFHLNIDDSLKLKGSKDELRSLVSNLVFNAVRYTPKGGSIFVDWYEEKGSKFFVVKDTGIGIAKKHISRLTERFYRVDKARSRDSGGTGLGLAIVKHVLIRHHGQLKVESEVSVGTQFACEFRS